MRGDARRISNWVEVPRRPTPPPPACRPFGLSRKRTTAMKNDFQFLPLLISLSGQRKTSHHPEMNRPPSSRGSLGRTAGAGSSRSGSLHFIQIVSRICVLSPALFWGQPPVSVGEYLAERKGYESRSADTNTHRIALFFMCSKTRCSSGGGGGSQGKL